MAIDYAAFQNLALRLIGENGRSVTLRKSSSTPADPNKPWREGDGNDTNVAATGVVVPNQFLDAPSDQHTKRGAFTALIAELDAQVTGQGIEEFDLFIDGGDQYSIRNVNVIAPGDTRIVYILELEK